MRSNVDCVVVRFVGDIILFAPVIVSCAKDTIHALLKMAYTLARARVCVCVRLGRKTVEKLKIFRTLVVDVRRG